MTRHGAASARQGIEGSGRRAEVPRPARIFTPEEGATDHIGLDHLPHVSTFVADWVADTFDELAR